MSSLLTQAGQPIEKNAVIVVAENFPGMAMSQWFVAVYRNCAAYDSPYEIISWMPKTGYSAGEAHDRMHENNRRLAELLAQSIRDAA
jgi:hypothetical protein